MSFKQQKLMYTFEDPIFLFRMWLFGFGYGSSFESFNPWNDVLWGAGALSVQFC